MNLVIKHGDEASDVSFATLINHVAPGSAGKLLNDLRTSRGTQVELKDGRRIVDVFCMDEQVGHGLAGKRVFKVQMQTFATIDVPIPVRFLTEEQAWKAIGDMIQRGELEFDSYFRLCEMGYELDGWYQSLSDDDWEVISAAE